MNRGIAVIDIGMTNKKVSLYDTRLQILDSQTRTFKPVMVDEVETHDLEGMEAWFLDTLSRLQKRLDIGAITVTTHGATMVCVDASGKPCVPCVYYTHDPGQGFQDRFYRLAGDPVELQAVTGTPVLSALINPAKGLLFAKEKFPDQFSRTKHVLSYPPYWGLRFTGVVGAEGTYAGCHTYLWDWKRECYSTVAEALGVASLMPAPLKDSWAVLGTLKPEVASRTGLGADTILTMGIHDSNASLLPHLAKRKRDFVLNSTGTWCVLMHPQERYGFAPDELGKTVFFNRSAYNTPVKTAIFLGGMEYETWCALIGSSANAPRVEDYRDVIRERRQFILPEVVPGSGQFPGSTARFVDAGKPIPLSAIPSGPLPEVLRDRARAQAVLNLSLVIQTVVSLERTGLVPGTDVLTEGGFRKNRDYNELLAAALPSNKVYLTDIAEATSFGAALTGVAALEGRTVESLADRFDVAYVPVPPMPVLQGFDEYRRAWLDMAAHG